jgi:hypothetical protein
MLVVMWLFFVTGMFMVMSTQVLVAVLMTVPGIGSVLMGMGMFMPMSM